MEQLILSKDEELDLFQVALTKFEPVDCPLRHVFLKGVYVRQIFMPAVTVNSNGEEVETVIISKVHKTQHPFFLSEGKVAVYNKADDFLGLIEAPYIDMTPAGTRRVLHIVQDAYWATIHLLPYITGNENNWPKAKKEALLMRIEQDLIEERSIECPS